VARLEEELEAKLRRLAADEGLDLLAIEVAGTARKAVVRLVIDRGGDGVSLADCELVSRQSSVLLDAYDPFLGSYTLEVSSPGLDRKLYSDGDSERFAGETVRVRMKPTWRGAKQVTGKLSGRADGQVTLRVKEDELVSLPENEIFETRLVPFADEREPARRGKR
jgi:ribosome maturation factor RimP